MTATTRKQQVFNYLHERLEEWVDGTALATETTGGSEGLRRLREQRAQLAARGYAIENRRHPNPARTVWQYRLVRINPVPVGDSPHVVPVDAPKGYVCPRSVCARVLTGIVGSEFDPKFGFGACSTHGLQQVRL